MVSERGGRFGIISAREARRMSRESRAEARLTQKAKVQPETEGERITTEEKERVVKELVTHMLKGLLSGS